MTEDSIREVAREVLRELAAAGGNGHAGAVPQVPPPPVAAVLRPSTWAGPVVPGEVIGDGGRGPEPAGAPGARVEAVTIESDEDLERFVRAALARRDEIEAGRLRFTLGRAPGVAEGTKAPAAPATTVRIAKGAVTERMIRDAAASGARLVLARGAVLTPLARDQARALGVEIEKEGRC